MLKHRHAIVFSLTRELLMLSIVLKTRRIRHCIGLMLLLGLTCMAQAQNSPASAAPTDQQALVGKVVFLELVTPDLMAAQRFYGGLLGWTFSPLAMWTRPRLRHCTVARSCCSNRTRFRIGGERPFLPIRRARCLRYWPVPASTPPTCWRRPENGSGVPC